MTTEDRPMVEPRHEPTWIEVCASCGDDWPCAITVKAEERGRQRGRAELEAELQRMKNERIVSVIFAHHKGAPRPFGLYRHADVSGVSGTGLVALGCEFEDGLVVLRWTSAWPTSVVFHERGIDSVKAIHGHDGRTEIVWLSEEVADLAEAEAVSEARGRAEAIADLRAERRRRWPDGPVGLGYVNGFDAAILHLDATAGQTPGGTE